MRMRKVCVVEYCVNGMGIVQSYAPRLKDYVHEE